MGDKVEKQYRMPNHEGLESQTRNLNLQVLESHKQKVMCVGSQTEGALIW